MEIARRFDEIVAFSEIEKFIDTPVKYYSSGMYVRLAFSVAAHLEPDILIVDEVLAVGDVAFQKKCLDRMSNSARQGRTVLFVSHNMSAVSLLCKSAIVLEQGCIKMIADSRKAIGEYLTGVMDHDTKVYNVENSPRPDPSLSRKVEFLSVELDGFPAKLVPADADLAMLMTVRGNQTVDDFSFNLSIYSANGEPVGTCSGSQVHSIRSGEQARYRLQLPNPRLAPGSYWIDLGMATGNERTGFREIDAVQETLHFEVMPPPGQDGTVSEWQPSWGMVRFREPATEKCD
jgi:lipopolysaccharide transport system ATP-binding protein